MTVEQILQKEIEESRTWLDRENEETTYKRYLQKRIELIKWAPKNSVGITCLVNYVYQIELVGLFMDCFAITLFYILLAI
jgi:hypothetical protein